MKIRGLPAAIIVLLTAGLAAYCVYPEKRLDDNAKIDKITVFKSKKQLAVSYKNNTLKIFKVSISRHPAGMKQTFDDDKTPEGSYTIDSKNPGSNFHKSLHISYPNEADIKNARNAGKNPGGEIEIHGLKNGLGFMGRLHRFVNWTRGCIALTNGEMDELYDKINIGTEIEIKP